MSAEIVNLRRARKARTRAASETKAAENRTRFGRTRTERELQAAREALEQKRLEALRREPGTPET